MVSPVTQPKVNITNAVFFRGAACVGQRLCPDVRGNSAADAPPLQQPHRQIAVVCAHVRQTAAHRDHVRQQLQPRL